MNEVEKKHQLLIMPPFEDGQSTMLSNSFYRTAESKEKNMNKKIIGIVMIVAAIFLVAGCNNESIGYSQPDSTAPLGQGPSGSSEGEGQGPSGSNGGEAKECVCVECDGVECVECECVEGNPPCDEHTFGEWNKTAPSCTTNGTKTRTCDCGETETKSEKPAIGHNFAKETIKAECFKDGEKTFICINNGCDYSYTIAITKRPNHIMTVTVITLPKCSTQGYTTMSCATEGCNHFETKDQTPATGAHIFNAAVDRSLMSGNALIGTLHKCDTCNAMECKLTKEFANGGNVPNLSSSLSNIVSLVVADISKIENNHKYSFTNLVQITFEGDNTPFSSFVFPGHDSLVTEYNTGKKGTYIRTENTWAKQ